MSSRSHKKLSGFAKLVKSMKGSKVKGNIMKKASKVWKSKKSLCKSPRKWVKGKRSVRKGHCRSPRK